MYHKFSVWPHSLNMSNLENASLQRILISYSEYERLKNIEEEFNKLQNQAHKNLLLSKSKYFSM